MENSKSSFWSIGRKAAAVLAGVVAVGFIISVTVQTLNQRADNYDQAAAANTRITKLLAIQVAGGVRFEQKESVVRAYKEFSEDKSANLSDVLIVGSKGAEFIKFDSDFFATAALQEYVETNLDKVKEGETITEVSGNHVIVLTPILAGKKKKYVGAMAVAWSLDALNKNLTGQVVKQVGLSVVILIAISILLLVLIGKLVTKPLLAMTESMGKLAQGHLDTEIPGTQRTDELGNMAAAGLVCVSF